MNEFLICLNQLKLLLWKNYALQKRSVIGTILELAIPALFAIILLPIRTIIKSNDHPTDTIYNIYSPAVWPSTFPLPAPDQYSNFIQQLGDDDLKWHIGYTPNNDPLINDLMNQMIGNLNNQTFSFVPAIGFPSEEDLVENLTSVKEYYHSLGGIVFLNTSTSNFTYKIRLHYSPLNDQENDTIKLDYDWKTNIIYSLFPVQGPRDKYGNEGGDPGYYNEGFLCLQSLVESYLIKNYSKFDTPTVNVNLQRFPYPPYSDDDFVLVIQALFPFIIMLSFVFTVILTAKQIAYEKETGIKEAMKLMGMKTWIYWLSWYIKTMLLVAPAVIFMIISFKVQVPLKNGGHAAILNQTNPIILCIFFFAFLSATITLTFVATTFFKKANSAATGAGIIYFFSYLPYIFISLRYQNMTLYDKCVSAFISNLGMSEAVQLIGMFEGKGTGIQWSNINEGINVGDNFTFLSALLILFADTFIHLILLYYFDQVLPGDHGISRPWYFPFSCFMSNASEEEEKKALAIHNENLRSYGGIQNNDRVTERQSSVTEATNKVFIENEAPYSTRKVGIKINGLNKIYKQLGKYKQAVQDLSLNIYENHITVLLGHNGAGKSTTISMITGISKPTSGQILVDNHDIINETKQARAKIGYCPQHNLLFPELTVAEHLRFFSKLKQNYDEDEIDNMLKSLNLFEKKKSLSKNLSGGQKRKLCVAIAFIGGSEIVILDEPTSGMDPQARHTIWTLLQNLKKDKKCSILLTTHFMDEADNLGDRIAIMSRGQLKCCGSPIYLKSMYGSGYNLILTRKTNYEVPQNEFTTNPLENTNEIVRLVDKYINNSKLNSDIAGEVSFILPKEECAKFPDLLIDLETNKEALHIVNIGISITTIEDVFLKIGEIENLDDHDFEKSQSVAHSSQYDINDRSKEQLLESKKNQLIDDSGLWIGSNAADKVISYELWAQQFEALFIKRITHTIRNKVLVIAQIIIPLACLIVVLIYAKYGPIKAVDSPSLKIMLKSYRDNFAPFQLNNNISNDSSIFKMSDFFQDQIKAAGNSKPFNINIDNQTYNKCSDNRSNINNFLQCVGDKSLAEINDNFILGSTFSQSGSNGDNKVDIISHFNNQPFHTPPLALNVLSNTLFKFFTNSTESSITVFNHPLPRDIKAKASDLKLKDATGFNVATDLTFGYSFLIGSFVMFLIKERVSGSKHIQYLSGANTLIFWISALIWDFFNFILTTILAIIIMWGFGINEFVGGVRLWYVFGLFVIYGLAHIPQSYLLSYLFSVPATGFAVTVAWNILASQVTLTTVGILQLPFLGLVDVSAQLEWVFLVIFPNFAFGQSLADLYANYQANQFCPEFVPYCSIPSYQCCDINPCCIGYNQTGCSNSSSDNCLQWTTDYLAWERPGLLRFFVFMSIQFVLQFTLILMYETGVLRKIYYEFQKLFFDDAISLQATLDRLELERVYGDIPKDEDVIEEERRIHEMNIRQSDDLLVMNGLTKHYNSFMAVKGISLGIRGGETFGLLGVNGAGKTSTFKMLTGDEQITKGKAYLNKTSIKGNIKRFQEQLGYCPQFDPLIDQQTVVETLMMFGRLRGIKNHLLKPLCYSLINLLDLNDHSYKMCFTLSGGNKRKLSVAISLIGSPVVVLLDEPTSGMDPKTRRFLWNCLNNIRNKGKSLILTSHNMDETEALCTRLGIMVNGELKCLGNLQHIKSRYGEGYTLMVKLTLDRLESDKIQEFITYILKTFENSEMKECRDGFINFHFKDKSVRLLANIFQVIENIKETFAIEFYIVTQTKLEQIFINFASKQIDPNSRYLTNEKSCSLKCC